MNHEDATEALLLVLNGILELKEQAAVANHVFSFLQAAGNLRAPFGAIAECQNAPGKLIVIPLSARRRKAGFPCRVKWRSPGG